MNKFLKMILMVVGIMYVWSMAQIKHETQVMREQINTEREKEWLVAEPQIIHECTKSIKQKLIFDDYLSFECGDFDYSRFISKDGQVVNLWNNTKDTGFAGSYERDIKDKVMAIWQKTPEYRVYAEKEEVRAARRKRIEERTARLAMLRVYDILVGRAEAIDYKPQSHPSYRPLRNVHQACGHYLKERELYKKLRDQNPICE